MTDVRAAQRWVLFLMSGAALMVALDQLVVSTALTTMQRGLHASLETLEWTVNAYSLSFAVLLMTAAALGDRWGRRRMLVAGLSVFTLASIGCALAPTVGWLIAARAVQGAGSASVMPLAMAMLTAAYPPEQRGKALGVFSALVGLAVVGGPLAGGAVTEGLAWQWIFWLNVPIGLVVIPLVLARTQESFGPRRSLDYGGIVLATAAALGLVWGLMRGNTSGWHSAEVLVALGLGIAAFAAFVGWELRVAEPMLPMRFFRSSAFAAGNASAFLLYATLMGALFFVSQYLQVVFRYGALGAGLRLLPWTVPLFVAGPVSGILTDRFGPRTLLSTGLLLQSAGLAWVSLNAADHRGYAASIAALVVAGAGVTMAMPAAQSAVLGAVPPQAIGKASGTFNTLRQLGAVFGIAVVAAVFAARGGYGTPRHFEDGFAPALAVAATMSLLGAGIALATPGRRKQAAESAQAPVPAGVRG
jgi:EmrB/QacA subfamily drug resistance transporter